jgi:hypothetical protein
MVNNRHDLNYTTVDIKHDKNGIKHPQNQMTYLCQLQVTTTLKTFVNRAHQTYIHAKKSRTMHLQLLTERTICWMQLVRSTTLFNTTCMQKQFRTRHTPVTPYTWRKDMKVALETRNKRNRRHRRRTFKVKEASDSHLNARTTVWRRGKTRFLSEWDPNVTQFNYIMVNNCWLA